MTCSIIRTITLLAFACCGLIAPTALVANTAISPHDPLFNTDEPLTITLTGPFKTLDKQRDKSAEYELGSLSYEGPNGPINIETRYNLAATFAWRRKTAPMRSFG